MLAANLSPNKAAYTGGILIYGVGEDGVLAFTDFGIESLIDLIKMQENEAILSETLSTVSRERQNLIDIVLILQRRQHQSNRRCHQR